MAAPYETMKIFLIILCTVVIVDGSIIIYNHHNDTIETFPDVEARFGAELILPMDGLIVMAEPIDACKPIQAAFNSSTFATVVLILGNTSVDCSVFSKVVNAENAGFEIAVLYGVNPFEDRRHHGDKLDPTEIPAIIINFNSGQKIRNNYLYNRSTESCWIKVTPNTQDISYYIMLFSVVIGICLIIMVLFMICLLIKCVHERRRSRRNRLSSSQINQLATRRFTSAENYDGGPCAICLDEFKEGDKLRILPCSHLYHMKCIDPWLLNNHRTCPLCKRKIRFGESDSESSDTSEGGSRRSSTAEDRPLLPRVNSLPELTTSQQRFRALLVRVVNNLGSSTEEENVSQGHSRPTSTYGSVNNSEGGEFLDALTPEEIHPPSVVNA